MSHGPFGKRVERLPVAQGGTAASTPDEARKQLGVPSLTENNTFAGDQVIQGLLEADQLHANLSITTDGTVVIEEGTIDAALLTGSQAYQLPDKSGTFAMTSDIVGGIADGDYGDVTVSGSGTAMSVDLAACPKIVGTYSVTGRNTAISQVLLASAPAGLYRMSASFTIDTSNEGFDVAFTPTAVFSIGDTIGVLPRLSIENGGFYATTTPGLSNGTRDYWSVVGHHASGDISFTTGTYVSSTDTFDIYVVLERLL